MFENKGKGWTPCKPFFAKKPKDPHKRYAHAWIVKGKDTIYLRLFRMEALNRAKAFA